MIQWVTAICFSLGILLASTGLLSWTWMLIGLSLGILLLLLQYRRIGNPLLSLAFNACVVGAVWFSVRQQYSQSETEDGSPSIVQRMSQSASSYAKKCFVLSGVGEDKVAILSAMLLGDRKSLSYEQKMRFRGAGVQHLLALSGLHIGIFIGILSFLLLRRARFSRWRWPVLIFSLVLLWGYCIIAGMPQSLLRAMLMATLYYIALFASDESHGSINLANTLLLMLLIDPTSLFDIGTQLSFAAVGAIIWLYPVVVDILRPDIFPNGLMGRFGYKVWQLFTLSVSAWMGTLPLCMYYFHQFQPWQPVVSVLLVPLTTILLQIALLLLLLSMAGLWFIAVPLANVVNAYMQVQNKLLDFACNLPCSTMSSPTLHVGHLLLFYVLFYIMKVGIQSPLKTQLYTFPALLFVILMLCVI